MRNLIKLNVRLLKDSDNHKMLEELGLEVEKEIIYSPMYIDADYIIWMYSNSIGDTNLLIEGEEFTVKENIEYIKELIDGIDRKDN